ncbi:MAG: sigma-70 family RNA polymerase sigma factor [Bacteroidota bacterium]
MKGTSSVYMSESGHITKPMAGQSLAQVVDGALDSKSDEVLITLFQQGERSAFRVLVERYQSRIKNLIYSIFHEPDVIDDLAQEVFIKAYEALPHFRFQSSFYTWLYRIAVNRSRDELRKRKVRRLFSLQALLESSDHELGSKLAVEPRDTEVQELIASALKTLPERFRTVIILKDIDGLSYEEIAEVLQCEMGTVKSRLFRARAMLRNVLKPLLEERT